MEEIRIIVLCSSRFGLPAIRELSFYGILSVVVVPASHIEMIEQLEAGLSGSSIALVQLKEKNYVSQLEELMKAHRITLGLILNFPKKIPLSVQVLAPKGFYNVHPGPLPLYRGADPVFMQIINREPLAGVSIHKLDEDFDSGEVVLTEMIRLDPRDTYGMLTTRLAALAVKMVGILIRMAAHGIRIPSKPQDAALARYYPKQRASDIVIRWSEMEAVEIIALVNACNPWNKGAVTSLNNQVVRIVDAMQIENEQLANAFSGEIISCDERGIMVATINGECILVVSIYTEEGFLGAWRFADNGFKQGARFTEI